MIEELKETIQEIQELKNRDDYLDNKYDCNESELLRDAYKCYEVLKPLTHKAIETDIQLNESSNTFWRQMLVFAQGLRVKDTYRSTTTTELGRESWLNNFLKPTIIKKVAKLFRNKDKADAFLKSHLKLCELDKKSITSYPDGESMTLNKPVTIIDWEDNIVDRTIKSITYRPGRVNIIFAGNYDDGDFSFDKNSVGDVLLFGSIKEELKVLMDKYVKKCEARNVENKKIVFEARKHVAVYEVTRQL